MLCWWILQCLEDVHENEEIWDVVENGPYVPTTVINEVEQIKVKGFWNEDDKKIVLFDKRLKTFLHHPRYGWNLLCL